MALTAADAYAVLDEQLSEAMQLQCRLPLLLKEMDRLKVQLGDAPTSVSNFAS